MSVNNGFIKEDEFRNYVNGKRFDELNDNFKSFVLFLTNGQIPQGTILCEKGKGGQKPDVILIIDSKRYAVSLKVGCGNSVHQEPFDLFIEFLKSIGVNERGIKLLKEFHYADGTDNDTGSLAERLSSAEYCQNNPEKIKELNSILNDPVIRDKIMERVLPELNDELAAKVGPFKNVDELKADIQKYLETTKKNEEEKRYSQKLFETILEKAEVDIQNTMIEREASQLMEEFKTTITQQGGNWEEVLEKEGKDKVWADLMKEAENRIKNSLVIQEIQKVEKIEISAQDIEQKFAELARMYGTDVKTIMNQFKGNPNVIYSLSQQAATQKVMEFLVANNTVKVK